MGSEGTMCHSNKSIKDFYKNSNVFVTGAAGFVGKALVEKLLRSCEDINKIYVLLREKRGKSAEDRYKDVLNNAVFDVIKQKCPERLMKIKVVEGDVCLLNLGMNDDDKYELIDNINIVFHAAANVRFNSRLKEAVTSNTKGTFNVLNFCALIKNIKSFVYVSTAYSNADRTDVEEAVYRTSWDVDLTLKYMEDMPDNVLEILSDTMLGKHPNTYTFSKALAENLLAKPKWTFPRAIVRPSIVTASWQEPFPGWIDNIFGVTGIMVEISRGSVRSAYGNPDGIMDLIPVDVVINTIVASAWYIVDYRPSQLSVFNCTSGAINKIYWKDLGRLTKKYSLECPTKYLNWYPEFTVRRNHFMHKFYELCLHRPLAYLSDIILALIKKKPTMLKICKHIETLSVHCRYFTLGQWNFHISCFEQLTKAVKSSTDGKNFNIDISQANGFIWENYFKDYFSGVRKFIMKEKNEYSFKNTAILHGFYWANIALQLVSFVSLLRLIYFILRIICGNQKLHMLFY